MVRMEPDDRGLQRADPEPPRRRSRPLILLAAAMAFLLVVATVYGVRTWSGLEGTAISGHGLFAMALGAVFSVLIGGGLMALVFISHRRGFDDQVTDHLSDRATGRRERHRARYRDRQGDREGE